MYSNELKNEIRIKLLNRVDSINQWIYVPKYVKSKKLEAFLEQVKHLTPFSKRLDESIYCILNDIFEPPTCYCGSIVSFIRFKLGYAQYCSVKCRARSNKWQQQVAETNKEKYGVEFIAQLPEEREKRSIQFKEQIPNFDYSKANEKRKNTIKERYGDTNTGWLPKAIETRINNKNMVPIELRSEYMEYYDQVNRLTKKQDLTGIPNIEKRGILGKDEDAHHLDHIFSIYDGFMNDIPVEIISDIVNLQCIPAYDNIAKRNQSWMEKEELLKLYEQRIRSNS